MDVESCGRNIRIWRREASPAESLEHGEDRSRESPVVLEDLPRRLHVAIYGIYITTSRPSGWKIEDC